MKVKIDNHIYIIGRIIANASYYYLNLDYLINATSIEEKEVIDSYPVLRKIRLTLWTLIILEVNKIIGISSNEKYRLIKLVNILIDHHSKINWHCKLNIKELIVITQEISSLEPKIKKIKEIRDTQIAHYDDVLLGNRLELQDLAELLSFCQETFNRLNFALNSTTTSWNYSEGENFSPLVKSIHNYQKIKELYYKHKLDGNTSIEISFLGDIMKSKNKF